jgi:glycogen debranching enzyme
MSSRNFVFLMSALLSSSVSAQAAAATPPADPAGGQYFSKKHYVAEALPTYASVRQQLPEPVLPSKPAWMGMYWKCWELAFSHLRQPEPSSPFVSNWLDEAFSPNIFQWDTCFMMMFARYGHYQFPAIQSLDNFYCRQHPSGFICREYRETDGKPVHFDFDGGLFSPKGWKNAVNPPLFSWAECESFKVTGDKSRFAMVLPVLEKYVEWLNRDGDPEAEDWESNGRRSANTPHGLYWNTSLGSGLDNTPKPTAKGAGWVDMSCQMVMQYHDIARICRELGQPEKAVVAEAEASAIAKRINRWCWDEEDGFYYDVLADGTKFRKQTACGFWPLIAGITTPAQTARLVAHLKDPAKFWRPFVFPTLAADAPEYKADGGYWLGGVWAPTNYAIIKGLERTGQEPFAAEASERYLAAMAEVFKTTGTVWENYSPEHMTPGNPSKRDFVGWSACGPIALLIENVLGFRPDGVSNTLHWNLRLAEPHGIRRLRFGKITADLLYDGAGVVTVTTDLPFVLTLNARQIELKPGVNSIKDVTPKP